MEPKVKIICKKNKNSPKHPSQNQNVALEQMKAATMVLNMLDYAIYIPSFFKDTFIIILCMIIPFILRPKKRIKFLVMYSNLFYGVQ